MCCLLLRVVCYRVLSSGVGCLLFVAVADCCFWLRCCLGCCMLLSWLFVVGVVSSCVLMLN